MRGVWTALITPFDDRGGIDLDSFRRILRDQADAGVTGVIPCGTTGESPTLSMDEKKQLIHAALDELKGSSVSVFAGTGSNNTAETIAFSRWACEQGVAGVLVVTPYYSKPSAAGLEAHFRAVADAVSCEVMLYNVPGRTGVSLTAASVAALAQHARIRTIKEASGNVAFTSEILDVLRASKQSMDVLSGDDPTFLPMLSIGALGVVSVASNLIPRTIVAIQSAFDSGKHDEAARVHQKFYPIFRDLFVESNPVPVKHAMHLAGWSRPEVRLPLVQLAQANARKLEESLAACGVKRGAKL